MASLSQYRADTGVSQETLAAKAGVKQATISRLERGVAMPSLALAVRIENITGGAVTAASWISQVTSPAVAPLSEAG